jgi:hypothetical protein
MITFNSFILYGLWLRFSTVFIGAILTFRHIGVDNIQFLFRYLDRSLFSIRKLSYWLVSFLSIIYFEYLVSNAKKITFTETYDKHSFLTILVSLLLIGIIVYAIYDSLQSFLKAKDIKQKIEIARDIKDATDFISFISWFTPWGVAGKVTIFAFIFAFSSGISYVVGKKVKRQISDTVSDFIESILRIVFLNLTIIILSVYLITGQITFF